MISRLEDFAHGARITIGKSLAYLEPAADWFPGISTVVNTMEFVMKGVLWTAEGHWKPSENTVPFIHHVAKKDIWSR